MESLASEHAPQQRRSRSDLRVAGALAAGLALSLLWAVSSFVDGVAFPPSSIAEALIRSAPGDVATFFIELLAHWALRLLNLVVLGTAILLGGQMLVSTADGSRAQPVRAGVALALLSGLATLAGPAGGVNVPGTIATLVGAALVYAVAAKRLVDSFGDSGTPDASRRRALRIGFGTVAGLALGGGVIGWLARRLAGPDTDVALVQPASRFEVPERSGFPSVAGLSPEVTTPGDHYVVDINLVRPVVEAADWELTVTGEVEDPLRLSFESLQSDFEVVEEFAVLTCVSNEVGGDLVGHSLWGGVRLSDVLEEAGASNGAVDVVFRAADGYSDSIPAEIARDPSVLLAFAQNRRPLTQDHGFPCRLRVPPIYGMKNVKWIEGIEVVATDYEGYWQKRGWSDEAVVRTQSRIDVAGSDNAARRGSPTWIGGVAWAGARGISKVEVSTDDGATWSAAQLRQPIGDLSWRQWAYRWTPERTGSAVVRCRATDGSGKLQTESLAPPHPAGATGLHSMTVEVS